MFRTALKDVVARALPASKTARWVTALIGAWLTAITVASFISEDATCAFLAHFWIVGKVMVWWAKPDVVAWRWIVGFVLPVPFPALCDLLGKKISEGWRKFLTWTVPLALLPYPFEILSLTAVAATKAWISYRKAKEQVC